MQLHAVGTCMFSTFSTLIIKHRAEPAVWARITYSILWESRSYFQLVQTNLIIFFCQGAIVSKRNASPLERQWCISECCSVITWYGISGKGNVCVFLFFNIIYKCTFNQWAPICGVSLTNDVCISRMNYIMLEGKCVANSFHQIFPILKKTKGYLLCRLI